MDRVVTFARENTALNIRLLPAMEVAGRHAGRHGG